MMGFFHDSFEPSPSKLPAVKCNWLTKASGYWKPEFEWCKENKKEVLREIDERKLHLERLLKHQTDQEKNDNKQELSNQELQKVDRIRRDIDALSADREFYSSILI